MHEPTVEKEFKTKYEEYMGLRKTQDNFSEKLKQMASDLTSTDKEVKRNDVFLKIAESEMHEGIENILFDHIGISSINTHSVATSREGLKVQVRLNAEIREPPATQTCRDALGRLLDWSQADRVSLQVRKYHDANTVFNEALKIDKKK